MTAARIDELPSLTDSQVSAIVELREQLTDRDGSPPLSDQAIVSLRDTQPGYRHLVAYDDAALTGYAGLAADGNAELAVAAGSDPGPLLDALVRGAGDELRIWARGTSSPLATILPERGFSVVRVLLQMRRPLSLPLDEPRWPDGVTARTFVVGQDEAAWLTVNNASFAGHPDQSGWTLADIAARETEPWFDPAGFFLAERDGELVGFHWTKVHPAHGDRDQIGEIYVIGVAPQMQGQRLGAALALHGLIHLREAGMSAAMLYVEEDNHGAIGLYQRLGFAIHDRDRCFRPG